MEKIICNILWEPIFFTFHKDGRAVDHTLGYFGEKDDAREAVNIFFNALKETQAEIEIKTYGSYRIDRHIQPEDETSNYYRNLHEFMLGDPYVVNYLKKKQPELFEGIKKTLEDMKSAETLGSPHPHDNLTDEEDNFC